MFVSHLPSTLSHAAGRLLFWLGLFLFVAGFRCGPTALDCLDDSDCSLGQTCQSYQCLGPSPQCKTSNECLSTQRCENGNCVDNSSQCQSNSDCPGQQECKAGLCVLPCEPKEVSCNNKDDDCNGKIDEELKRPCFDGGSDQRNRGVCKDGTQTCSEGKWGSCEGQVKAQKETCNNKDDDCNGKIDEELTRSCFDGTSEQRNKGVCRDGTQTCAEGKWGTCTGQVKPSEETCDRRDNNCDGQVDEGCSQTRKLYEWCDATHPCETGLTCHYNMCYQSCDSKQGIDNNPACRSLEKHECWKSPEGKDVCKKQCKWGTDEEECPKGTHCLAKVDHCQPNRPPLQGTRKLNEGCSLTDASQFCDAAKGLVCMGGKCKLACDPKATTSECTEQSTCVPTDQSFTGGFCSP